MFPRVLNAIQRNKIAFYPLLFVICVLPALSRADTFNWNNTGTDFNAAASWTNANILGPAGPPDFNDIAQFNLLRVNNPVVTSLSATAVEGIRFDTLGTDYTLSTATSQLAIGPSGIQANNPTGTNTITASLVLNANESINQVTGGTLNVTGPAVLGGSGGLTLTIGSLSGNGTINFSPSSVEVAGDLTLQTNVDVTLPAVTLLPQPPGPPIGLTKSGSAIATITGTSTYDGLTTISGGTLRIGNGGTTGTLGTGNVVDNATLSFNRSDAMTVANTISGSGSVRQIGAGTTTLTANNSYSGGTVVNAGTLLINGNQSGATGGGTVSFGATLGGTGIFGGSITMNHGSKLSPGVGGAPGSLAAVGTFQTGEVTFFGASALLLDIADATNFDRLSIVGGNLNIGGSAQLTLSIDPGFTVPPGLSFLLVSNDGTDAILGTFSNAPISGNKYTLGGTEFLVNYAGGDGNDLIITAVPEPGTWLAAVLMTAGMVTLRRRRRGMVNSEQALKGS